MKCLEMMTNMGKRPPLGLMPKDIWIEQRLEDVMAAIDRRLEIKSPIPSEWIEEYNWLLTETEKGK